MTMFDVDSCPKTARPGHCLCCSKEFVAVTGPASYRRQFRSMVGRAWPGSISLNLHRDFTTLGLDTANAPERATLCLVCAVDHMTEFNTRLSRRNGAGAAVPDRPSRGNQPPASSTSQE